jgi:hypothetical protein
VTRYNQQKTSFENMHEVVDEYELGSDLLKNLNEERNHRYHDDDDDDDDDGEIPPLIYPSLRSMDQITAPGDDEEYHTWTMNSLINITNMNNIIYRTQTNNELHERFVDSYNNDHPEEGEETDSIS